MNTQSTGAGAGHVMTGTLGTEDVRALFERCASLKFTGLLELSEGARRTSITFVGGEPLDGPDLFKLGAVWRRGSYRLVQRALDLSGSLADDVHVAGSLAEASPMDLFRHCEEYRLSAEVDFTGQGGQRAKVRFGQGRMESAEVNGQPNMAALAAIGGWTEGTFRLTLRPLFAESAARGSGAAEKTGVSDFFENTVTVKVPLWQVDPDEVEDTPPPEILERRPGGASPEPLPPAPSLDRPSLFGARNSPAAGTPTAGARPSLFPPGTQRPMTPAIARPAAGQTQPPSGQGAASPASARPAATSAGLGGTGDSKLTPQPFRAARPTTTQPIGAPMPSRPVTSPTVARPAPSTGSGPTADPDVPFRTVRPTVRSQVVPPAEHPVPLDPSEPAQPTAEPTVRMEMPPSFGEPRSRPAPVPSLSSTSWDEAPTEAQGSRIARSPLAMMNEAATPARTPDADPPPLAPAPPRPVVESRPAPPARVEDRPPVMERPPVAPVPVIRAEPAPPVTFAPPPAAPVFTPPAQMFEAPPLAPPPTAPHRLVDAPPPASEGAADDSLQLKGKKGRGAWFAIGGVVAVGGAVLVAALWPRSSETPQPPIVNPAPVVAAPTAAVPSAAAPTAGAATAGAAVKAPVAPSPAAKAPDEGQMLVLSARKAMIEGRKKDALKAFKAAYRANPKDPAFAIYVPMALGKTGRGKLVLAGKGVVTVDGHAFKSPKKMSVAAGPHTVEVNGKSEDITVDKGGSQVISATDGASPAAATLAPVKGKKKVGKAPKGGGKIKRGGKRSKRKPT